MKHKKPNLILLTNTRGSVWQRSIGAYQVAHRCRENGLIVQVIDFLDFFELEELIDIIKKLVNKNLLSIGISTTFHSILNNKNPLLSTNAISDLRSSIDLDDKIFKLFTYFKKEFPDIKLIAGGANSCQVDDNSLFDAVFHGYSEESLVKYLDELSCKRLKKIYPIKGKTKNINGDLEKFDIENLSHRWISSDIILEKETCTVFFRNGHKGRLRGGRNPADSASHSAG